MVSHLDISEGSGVKFRKHTKPIEQLVYAGRIVPRLMLFWGLTITTFASSFPSEALTAKQHI